MHECELEKLQKENETLKEVAANLREVNDHRKRLLEITLNGIDKTAKELKFKKNVYSVLIPVIVSALASLLISLATLFLLK